MDTKELVILTDLLNLRIKHDELMDENENGRWLNIVKTFSKLSNTDAEQYIAYIERFKPDYTGSIEKLPKMMEQMEAIYEVIDNTLSSYFLPRFLSLSGKNHSNLSQDDLNTLMMLTVIAEDNFLTFFADNEKEEKDYAKIKAKDMENIIKLKNDIEKENRVPLSESQFISFCKIMNFIVKYHID